MLYLCSREICCYLLCLHSNEFGNCTDQSSSRHRRIVCPACLSLSSCGLNLRIARAVLVLTACFSFQYCTGSTSTFSASLAGGYTITQHKPSSSMMAASRLCVIAVCIFAASLSPTTAQLPISCAAGSARLLDLLQASPSELCLNQTLTLVKIPREEYINASATVFHALSVICESACLRYVHGFAQECVPSYVELLGQACGRNQEVFCWQTVARNNGTDVLRQCFPDRFIPRPPVQMPENTTEQPSTTDASPNTTETPVVTCNDGCPSALMAFRTLHMCCVSNAFNSTLFGLKELGIADYSTWSACNVETITESCPTPPELVEDILTTVGTASSYTVVAHTVFTVLMAFISTSNL